MRRQRLALLFTAVLGLLALPAAAPAKEVSQVRLCGGHGQCTAYDTSDFKSLMFLAQDAGPTDPPAAPAPWYRVRFTVDEREHGGGYERWTVAYVPSAASLRVRDEGGGFAWAALTPRAAAALERAARSLPALPETRLTGLRAEPPATGAGESRLPAGRAGATSESTGGSAPWSWIAVMALGAALLLAALGRTVRRRHRASMVT